MSWERKTDEKKKKNFTAIVQRFIFIWSP